MIVVGQAERGSMNPASTARPPEPAVSKSCTQPGGRVRTGMMTAQAGATRKSEYLLYKRGREDGEAARPIASGAEIYIESYELGRALAARGSGDSRTAGELGR